jgi:hypothetical protein
LIDCFLCLSDKDCYWNLPTDIVEDNPLDMANMKEQQIKDKVLLQQAKKYEDWYTAKGC